MKNNKENTQKIVEAAALQARRILWFIGGVFFLILAIIGIILPVIPQIPFVIASITCFMKFSNKFRIWVENKTGGKSILQYLKSKYDEFRAKIKKQ